MPKFRKKPVILECGDKKLAEPSTQQDNSLEETDPTNKVPLIFQALPPVEAEQWFPGLHVEGVLQPNPNSMTQFAPHVVTPAGSVELSPGDWIVREEKGTFVYKNEIFEQSYEPENREAQIIWTQAYGFNDPVHDFQADNRSDDYVATRLDELRTEI